MPAPLLRSLAMVATFTATTFGFAHAATSDLQQFAFGSYHRCALTTKGSVQCLGESNVFGQIGNGQSGDSPTHRPVQVIARGATKLAVGDFFACAIVDGALDCWGDIPVPGGRGRRPTRVIAAGVTDVAAGERHACAIVKGAVQCWGANFSGQTVPGSRQTEQPTPWTVVEAGAASIAAGDEQSCAIVAGALWCWGRTGLDLKSADTFGISPAPVKVFAQGVGAVAAGTHHACAIVDGALWCWGDNSYGQIGIGVSIDHARHSAGMPPPNMVAAFVDGEQRCFSNVAVDVKCRVDHPLKIIAGGVTAVAARYNQTCAIAGGALYCWGNNERGQLGIAPSAADVLKPTEVVAGGVTGVATGYTHTCALVDGALRCSEKGAFDNGVSPFGVSGLEARLGVWRGSIGKQRIMLCLRRPPYASTYYYLRHKFGIALSDTSGNGSVWSEEAADRPGARWKLQLPEGDRLEGEWSDADGKASLPISLTRVSPAGDGDPGCAIEGADRTAFNAPRVAAEKLTIEESSDQRRILVLNGSIAVVELLEKQPNAAPFNQAMRNWLRDQIAEYYECALQRQTVSFNKERSITFRAGPWLVVEERYDVYCGGAHPSGGIAEYQTWNLARGKRVNPWAWIRGSSSRYGTTAPPKLNALILAQATRNKDDDDCLDAVNANASYLLRPAARGLVFSTSFAHVIQACNEDIEIPYAALLPFLTQEGRQAVESLMQARAAPIAK